MCIRDSLKNNKIKSFSIHTIDNNEEYSNCLKIDEDDYQQLKNNICNALKSS